MSRGTKNQLATRRELGDQFKNQGDTQGGPVARYINLGGLAPRDVTGDEQAPWLKVPPFLTDPSKWVTGLVLPTSDYVAMPEVECNNERIISVDFSLTLATLAPGSFGAQLSIVPEKRGIDRDGNVAWYALGVVNPALSAVTLANFGDNFGSRTVYPSELRTPAFTASAARTVNFNLQWEVGAFDAFRLNFLQLTEGGNDAALDVFYQLAQ